MLALCGGCLGAIIFFFLWKPPASGPAAPWLSRWHTGSRILRFFARFYQSCALCRSQPRLLAATFSLSIANQMTTLLACYCFAQAIQAGVSFGDCLTFLPMIGVISTIPITPGGLGIREGLSIQLFGSIGVPHMKAFLITFLPYVSLLLWSLIGGLFFLAYFAATGHTLRREFHELEEEGLSSMVEDDSVPPSD